jgi:septal ring factor EnvC (AmiA/AmiB activator)
MTENLADLDPELFVGKPSKFQRPPKEWLDAVSPETRSAIDELETAAAALAEVDADIEAAQAHVVECADVLRAAQEFERAHPPMTPTQLAQDYIRQQRAGDRGLR